MKRARELKFLTLAEVARLMKAIRGKRDRALFLLAYRHGLRASELGLLRVEDIDYTSMKIQLQRLKGSHGGLHPLQPDEARLVRQWIKERSTSVYANTPTLFISNRGLPISRRTLDYLMKQYCRKAGIPGEKAHFHALKHSIATHLLSAGQEVRWVQDWLGHKNVQNTVIYTHVTSAARDTGAARVFARLPRF
jgi:type 1 fimbriae regulatory protein FimB